MAATSTGDTRTHVMGDMLMITGTFSEGGTEFSYDGLLSTVFAAGGHLTSTAPSGLTINNGATEAIGQTVLTVDTGSVAGDARSCVYVGQTLYNGISGARLGKITAVNATTVTIDTALTEALPDDAVLHVRGASKMSLLANAAITAQNNSLDVSIDEANSLVIFDAGRNIDAADSNNLTGISTDGGRFWILGQR